MKPRTGYKISNSSSSLQVDVVGLSPLPPSQPALSVNSSVKKEGALSRISKRGAAWPRMSLADNARHNPSKISSVWQKKHWKMKLIYLLVGSSSNSTESKFKLCKIQTAMNLGLIFSPMANFKRQS